MTSTHLPYGPYPCDCPICEPRAAVDGPNPCPACGALPCDWVNDPRKHGTPPTPATDERALLERVFRHGFSDGWRSNQTGRQSEPLAASGAWHFYVADGALQKSVEATTPATEEREAVARAIEGVAPRLHFYRRLIDKSAYEVVKDTDPDGPIGDETFKRVFLSQDDDECAAEAERLNWQARADAALSALAPIRAAEILAAEANERARILHHLETLQLTWNGPVGAGAIGVARAQIQRNEHGAGK